MHRGWRIPRAARAKPRGAICVALPCACAGPQQELQLFPRHERRCHRRFPEGRNHRPPPHLDHRRESQGQRPSRFRRGQDLLRPDGLFGEAQRRAKAEEEQKRSKYGKLALKALETLHLDENATPEIIRAKYKSWVKQLHPDANNGDRSREEKLREIIRAYNTLKSAGHA
jgi:hypothetical protein